MELSTRLEALIRAVDVSEAAADIGTDHGFLPIELVRRGICRRMIACDVRKGPLERADKHIRAASLSDRIETRLADGLSGLKAGEVQTVVIAGMGGNLMASLLEKADPEVIESLECLVLQPQSEFDKLRLQVEKLGFVPVREEMLIDREKYYWLLVCRKKQEEAPSYREAWQCRYGVLLPEAGDAVLMQYLTRQQEVLEKLQNDLKDKEGEHAQRRREELEAELSMIRSAKNAKGRKKV